jgi:hypothetical protein
MRSIRQPGPPPPERAVAVPCRATPLRLEIPPGLLLRDAVADAVAARGFDGAVFRFLSGGLGPFAYVMPALSPDGRTAAWYSETYRPEGVTALDTGALTLGVRDGAAFFHAHAIWREASGKRGAGHILPEVATAALPVLLEGVGLHGARFEAAPDPETGFILFAPVAVGTPPDAPNALALRLRPNQDMTQALEDLARPLGPARVEGGVGSTIGARWVGGTGDTDRFATEMFLSDGHIAPGGGRLTAGLVTLDGDIRAGRLVRGDNPVLMTLEAVLVAV